jgi:hypothetical protein
VIVNCLNAVTGEGYEEGDDYCERHLMCRNRLPVLQAGQVRQKVNARLDLGRGIELS